VALRAIGRDMDCLLHGSRAWTSIGVSLSRAVWGLLLPALMLLVFSLFERAAI
jgi:hypothetical protein